MPDPIDGPLADYARVLARAREDDAVVGVVVVGPHAAGVYVHAGSDVDAYVVTRRDADAPGWRTPHGSPVEIWPMSIATFRDHAMPGTADAWNRPTFLRARVDLDRLDGEIGRLIERKGRLEPEEARAIAAAALDDYVNALYRSLKGLEGGRTLEGRLDAMESIGPALTTAFALEGRVRPFNKWLVDEIGRRPLALPALLEQVERIALDPTPVAQRALFRDIERAARSAGHGEVIDGWEPDVAWLLGATDHGRR